MTTLSLLAGHNVICRTTEMRISTEICGLQICKTIVAFNGGLLVSSQRVHAGFSGGSRVFGTSAGA